MNVPQILTLNEVADFLGVGTPAVAAWAQDGLLPACARSESGELLFYRWRVERDGPKLAANELVRFRAAIRRRPAAMLHEGARLSCGCALDGAGQPVWLCFEARTLQFVAQLTAAFAATAPGDVFFGRLARGTAETLARHLAPAAPASRKTEPDHG